MCWERISLSVSEVPKEIGLCWLRILSCYGLFQRFSKGLDCIAKEYVLLMGCFRGSESPSCNVRKRTILLLLSYSPSSQIAFLKASIT
jgi:hypothetical protein